MTKRIDPRSPKKKAKDAAYASLPPAIIFKPLQFIGNNTPSTVKEDPITKMPVRVPSPEFEAAREQANLGNGLFVKGMARRIDRRVASALAY